MLARHAKVCSENVYNLTWKMEKELEKDKKSPSSSEVDSKLTNVASDGHTH